MSILLLRYLTRVVGRVHVRDLERTHAVYLNHSIPNAVSDCATTPSARATGQYHYAVAVGLYSLNAALATRDPPLPRGGTDLPKRGPCVQYLV